MKNIKNVSNNVSLSITINIFIATAIQFFINPKYFLDEFPKLLASLYGFSIIFWLLNYIFIDILEHNLDEQEFKVINKMIILNLIFNTILLFFVIYPDLIPFSISVFVIAIAVTVNILLPPSLFLKLLVKKIFNINLYTNNRNILKLSKNDN